MMTAMIITTLHVQYVFPDMYDVVNRLVNHPQVGANCFVYPGLGIIHQINSSNADSTPATTDLIKNQKVICWLSQPWNNMRHAGELNHQTLCFSSLFSLLTFMDQLPSGDLTWKKHSY